MIAVRTLLLGIVSLAFPLAGSADLTTSEALTTISQPTARDRMQLPKPPPVAARAFLLMDAYTGQVLVEQQANQRFQPASLTKMMTMYIVSDRLAKKNIHLSDQVNISEHAWKAEGSRMFLKLGSQVPLADLAKGVIIQSGNDASIALAEHVAGTEQAFVELMNQAATQLGLKHSHFASSTGLPDKDNYSTAYDMAQLARALILHYPEDYRLYKEKWFTYHKIKQPNRNRLLWRDPDIDGIKTGHTQEAGYCLVASAYKPPLRLISVVLGAPHDKARINDSQRLLIYGFRFFENHTLYEGRKPLGSVRVWKAQDKRLPIGLASPLSITIPKSTYPLLKAELSIPEPLIGPFEKNKVLGQVIVSLDGRVLLKKPIIALAENPKGSWWQSTRDGIVFRMHAWFGKDTISLNTGAELIAQKQPLTRT